jgi:hypothetical protein
MLTPGIVPDGFFNMWRASRKQRPIKKVTDPPSLLQASSFFANFTISTLVALTAQLEAAEKALSEEKATRSAANRSLAEAKADRLIVNQALRASEEAKVALAQDLHSAQASLTATTEKLISESSALDFAVIGKRKTEIKLQASEEKREAQEELLASTPKALSKLEFSSLTMISSVVAHAMALVKNHTLEFDTEIFQKDFTVDDVGREALVDSADDTAQHIVSLYNFSVLANSDDNISPGVL